MAEIDERKALDRLSRSIRNLTSGARLGASEPPPEELEEPAPGEFQPTEAAPQALNPPPEQS